MKPTPSFNQLLEQYVFVVAEQVIDRVDAETQTRLIKLIHQIDTETPLPDTVCSLAGLELNAFIKPPQRKVNLPGKLPCAVKGQLHQTALGQVGQLHQQQLTMLTTLTQRIAQVKTRLAQTQAKLQEQIYLNEIALIRSRALAKV